MRRPLPILLIAMLTLAACGSKPAGDNALDEAGLPQDAVSIEDYAVPTDKSDQITSIDAATGDASGMPKDGGGVVQQKKAEARPAAEAAPTPDGNSAAPAPVAPAAAARPAFTIEDVPGTN